MSTRTRTFSLATDTWAGACPTVVEAVDVHKIRDAALLLDTWRPDGPNRFVTSSRWPRTHPHFGAAVDGTPPLALAAESLRQAVILVSHRGYDVPRDSAFVMRSLSVSLLAPIDPAADDTTVTLSIQCDKIRHQGALLRGMEATVEFRVDGEVIGFGHGDLTLLPAAVYARLRENRPPLGHRTPGQRCSPVEVGVEHEADVLLGDEADGSLAVRVDTAHPHHFDHPTDHIPGMVLVEAALQAHARSLGGSVPVELVAEFFRYAELVPSVTAEPECHDGARATTTTFRQDGTDVAAVRVRG